MTLQSTTPATNDLVRLAAAVHWRVSHPFALEADVPTQVTLTGRLCGAQLSRTLRQTGFDAQALVVCSTVMSAAISMEAEGQARFHDAIERACGLRPQGLVNAYMCTGWAFALRHFMRHTSVERLAIAIVDLDLHNMAWQRCHPVIGPSGFGVTTLLLDLPADRSQLPRCSGPHANSAFNDFVMGLKAHLGRHGPQPTFIPFTQGALATTAQRVLGSEWLGPNRNAEYGHCFGADPWIGLIEWFSERGVPAPTRSIAGAIAFNGYYAFAPLQVDPRTQLEFLQIDGDVAALEHCIAASSVPLCAPVAEAPPYFMERSIDA